MIRLKKYIISAFILLYGILITPGFIHAKDDCNGFGKKCHVDGINTYHTNDSEANSTLLDVIKNAVNWCLGMLATIALVICLYGGFKMILSAGDSKKYSDGRTILKNALIGLAVILLAWMIVSVVFRFVATLSGGNQTLADDVK